jgi:hypothetical protein
MEATITREGDELTIELEPPIKTSKGAEIGVLRLTEPTARQVRDAEQEMNAEAPYAGQVAYEIRLVGTVAGLNRDAQEALPVGIVNVGIEFLQEFIEADDGEDDAEAPPQAVDIPINPPISFAGSTYAELPIREPLASEIRKARQLVRGAGSLFESRRAQMSLLASVSGLPQPVIDALPIRVCNRGGRVLSRFTTAGRRTGKP